MDNGQVILVNEKDDPVGVADKMEAHQKGLLHRAFSIFIFNSKGEMLLQQRALNKYHSAGLWSNTCCSHPAPGEELLTVAQKRLKEEMGFEVPVKKIFNFLYKTDFANGLTENEFDHVLVGEYDGPVIPNNNEVMDHCYKDVQEIGQSLKKHPGMYSVWFQLAFPEVLSWWQQHYTGKAG
jgi:isopentenyl-diphosphate Delta-isomerase